MKQHPNFKNYYIFEEDIVLVKLEPPPDHVPMTKEKFDFIVQNQQKWRTEFQENQKEKHKQKKERIKKYNRIKRLEIKNANLPTFS